MTPQIDPLPGLGVTSKVLSTSGDALKSVVAVLTGHPLRHRMEQPGTDARCRAHADRSAGAIERWHDLGGEPFDALLGGLSAVEQDVLDADGAQDLEFRSDSIGRAVQGARLSCALCAGIGRDVRSVAPVRMLR